MAFQPGKLLTFALTIILSLVLSSCDNSSDADRTKIAVLLSESGPADFIGKPEGQILRALERQFQGTELGRKLPILKFYDTGTSIQQAENIFAEISADNQFVAIIGPSTSGESIALANRAQQNEIPLLSLASSKKIIESKDGTNEWAFKFAQNDDLAAERVIRTIAGVFPKQMPNIYFLYANDGFGKSGAEVFRAQVNDAKSLGLVDERAFSPAIPAPDALIESLPEDIDALVIWGTSPGPSLLVRAAKKLRPQLSIFLSHGNASHQFIADTGVASEGVYIIGSRVLLTEEFLKENSAKDRTILEYRRFWEANFGGHPNHFGGHAYDAYRLLISIYQDGVPNGRRDLRRLIETQKSFPGVTGTFNFSRTDHAGLSLDAFESYQIQDGKFIPISFPQDGK